MSTPDLSAFIAGILSESLWSSRFPLRRAERLASLSPKDDPVPRTGGVYRIHLEEQQSLLAYVGQTGRLRGRLNELALGVYSEVMPYTTPHVAAPSLWAWSLTPPYAPLLLSFFLTDPMNAYYRQALEDFVLAYERQKRKRLAQAGEIASGGYSPLAQFGKMPKGWEPSSSRARGERGGVTLVDGPWHAPSIMPVGVLDDPCDAFSEAWGGYHWAPWRYAREIPLHVEQRGLYRLWRTETDHLWYIGSGHIATASRDAARRSPDLLFSAVLGRWTNGEMEELKRDLLGLHLYQQKRPPLEQYMGEKQRNAGNPWPEEIQQGDEHLLQRRGN